MKLIVLIALLFFSFSSSLLIKPTHTQNTKPLTLIQPQNVKGVEFCKVCITFIQDTIYELIEIIANNDIGGTCQFLCSHLNHTIEVDICTILCEIVGLEEFVKIIDEVNPDPIEICEELTACEHSTTAKASISQFSVSPLSGPQGTTFDINMVYAVQNTIATGQVEIVVVPPQKDASLFGGVENVYEQGVGNYGLRMSFKAVPSENEPFGPGIYTAAGVVCEGTCGSKHKWSYTLAEQRVNFTITA